MADKAIHCPSCGAMLAMEVLMEKVTVTSTAVSVVWSPSRSEHQCPNPNADADVAPVEKRTSVTKEGIWVGHDGDAWRGGP